METGMVECEQSQWTVNISVGSLQLRLELTALLQSGN